MSVVRQTIPWKGNAKLCFGNLKARKKLGWENRYVMNFCFGTKSDAMPNGKLGRMEISLQKIVLFGDENSFFPPGFHFQIARWVHCRGLQLFAVLIKRKFVFFDSFCCRFSKPQHFGFYPSTHISTFHYKNVCNFMLRLLHKKAIFLDPRRFFLVVENFLMHNWGALKVCSWCQAETLRRARKQGKCETISSLELWIFI